VGVLTSCSVVLECTQRARAAHSSPTLQDFGTRCRSAAWRAGR